MLEYNKKHIERTRELRKNMTDEEVLLWSKLRKKQMKNAQFYRQKPIGNYIVDFYCPKYKLVIELDGSQHFTDDSIAYDKERDEYLNAIGLKVLRFTNKQIHSELDLILEQIYNEI